MKPANLDNYLRQVRCTYRGETYLVRDNGAVFRQRKGNTRLRQWDEKWTFGSQSKRDGYMFISSIRVHHIVATAFHGPQPSKTHVVDHIDTNRSNNRPVNLRWVTQAENSLLSPNTVRKIENAYGSIESYIANPDCPKLGKLHPDYEWICSVPKNEAEEIYRPFLDWTKSQSMPSAGTFEKWLYTQSTENYVDEPESEYLIESRTLGANQKNWKTPSDFPLCPSEIDANALGDYCDRLKHGEVFSRNDYGESKVVSAELSESSETLIVLCDIQNGVKGWALAEVSIEDGLFVHENLGSFFTLEGATKQYVLRCGLKWEGGDSIDDYC